MNNKKIIIVCKAFYPEITPRAFRATELAIQFSKMGHHVMVVTANRNYDYTHFEKTHKNVEVRLMEKSPLKDFTIRKNRFLFYPTRLVTKLLEILLDYPNIAYYYLVPKVLKNISDYDMLISIAYPHSIHWGTGRVFTKNKKPAKVWIADSGDPFMGSTLDFKKPFYFKYLEKNTFNKVDHMTVPFRGAVKAYYPEFRNKIEVIPQGFRFSNDNRVNLNSDKSRVPTFLYAGLFIAGKRDPRPFIDYLLTLKQPFLFIVYTKQAELLKKQKEIAGDMISIRDYIPREKLIKVMETMDFLVNFDNNVHEMLPSKLIDYAITGRPILNIKENLDKETISSFLEGNYDNAFKIENIEQYRIENVVNRFLALLD